MNRPNHIEDYLCTVRTGQWYGFSDPSNKIYANLIVHDGGSKPTESEINSGLAAMQSEWDEKNKQYKFDRIYGYGSIGDQLDKLYHDMKDGKLGVAATTGSWYVGITCVKNAFPKPS